MSAGRHFGALGVGGMPFRICLFFAANPHETLHPSDVSAKFGIGRTQVPGMLKSARRLGLIAQEGGGLSHKEPCVYSAGPALLAIIGRTPA